MQKTLTEKRFFEWHEDDVAVTLRNRGGSYGHGSEVLVICLETFHCTTEIDGVAQPLKARDYKDPLVVMYEM